MIQRAMRFDTTPDGRMWAMCRFCGKQHFSRAKIQATKARAWALRMARQHRGCVPLGGG